MNIAVKGPLGGEIQLPASKSQAHRMLICAALADTDSLIVCQAINDDIMRSADCLRCLGAKIDYDNGVFKVKPIVNVHKSATLDCGESGSTLRFLLPVAAALSADATFTGKGRLPQRPLSPLYEQMSLHGVKMSENGVMPLVCNGTLTGGEYTIKADISSQFISGLLFALPLTRQECRINLTGETESGSYIDMTLDTLRNFGIKVDLQNKLFIIPANQQYRKPMNLSVEGDWSSAAFWLVAGAIGKKEISCTGLNLHDSHQGDRAVVEILKRMGAHIELKGDRLISHPSELHGCQIDCHDTPDLVPALACAAAFAHGITVFDNISRLRIKESDRVEAVCDMLKRFGIDTHTTQKTLSVNGGAPHMAIIESFSDHRIAMAAAVVGASIDGQETIIKGAECVNKSYPAFFDDLKMLGGIARQEQSEHSFSETN